MVVNNVSIVSASRIAEVTPIIILSENGKMQYVVLPLLCVRTPREAGSGDDEKDGTSANNVSASQSIKEYVFERFGLIINITFMSMTLTWLCE